MLITSWERWVYSGSKKLAAGKNNQAIKLELAKYLGQASKKPSKQSARAYFFKAFPAFLEDCLTEGAPLVDCVPFPSL